MLCAFVPQTYSPGEQASLCAAPSSTLCTPPSSPAPLPPSFFRLPPWNCLLFESFPDPLSHPDGIPEFFLVAPRWSKPTLSWFRSGQVTALTCSLVCCSLLDHRPLSDRRQPQGCWHRRACTWVDTEKIFVMWNTKAVSFLGGLAIKVATELTFYTLVPFLTLVSGMRRDYVEEVPAHHQRSLWLSQFQGTLGCVWAGLWSLCPACVPCSRRLGLRAAHASERTLGLHSSFFKIFILDLKLHILTVLPLKSCYFVYLIIYINLLKSWIHFFYLKGAKQDYLVTPHWILFCFTN